MSSGVPDAIPGPSHAYQPMGVVHQLASAAVREAGNGSSTNGSNTPARPRK